MSYFLAVYFCQYNADLLLIHMNFNGCIPFLSNMISIQNWPTTSQKSLTLSLYTYTIHTHFFRSHHLDLIFMTIVLWFWSAIRLKQYDFQPFIIGFCHSLHMRHNVFVTHPGLMYQQLSPLYLQYIFLL